MASEQSDIEQALCGLKASVQRLAERVVGEDVANHLQQSASHVILAAQASVDRIHNKMDECQPHTDSDATPEQDSSPSV